jgi:predicted dehydrogenase
MFTCAVVGLGQIGLMYDFDEKRTKPSSHVLAYSQDPGFQLVAASDTRIEQEQHLHQLAPDVKFYANYQEMLADCPVDVISICTHAQTRVDMIDFIVRYTKTKMIFCEKPLGASAQDAAMLSGIVEDYEGYFIPNLSRRWNSGINRIKDSMNSRTYGSLQKIHLRYTRGIFNTGSHLFDMIRFLVGEIQEVRVVNKVYTSSELSGELSFSFEFTCQESVAGYAEAFDDTNYYMFEVDLYFEAGKIEITRSGDQIRYLKVGEHPLFAGLRSLVDDQCEQHLLSESTLGNAITHLHRVLSGVEQPVCSFKDGMYPLFVAEALMKSYSHNGSREKVVTSFE